MRASFAIARGVPEARDVFGEMREAAGLVANHLRGPRQGVAVAIVRVVQVPGSTRQRGSRQLRALGSARDQHMIFSRSRICSDPTVHLGAGHGHHQDSPFCSRAVGASTAGCSDSAGPTCCRFDSLARRASCAAKSDEDSKTSLTLVGGGRLVPVGVGRLLGMGPPFVQAPESGQAQLENGVSVAVDEAARGGPRRQGLARGRRARELRAAAADNGPHATLLRFDAHNRPMSATCERGQFDHPSGEVIEKVRGDAVAAGLEYLAPSDVH